MSGILEGLLHLTNPEILLGMVAAVIFAQIVAIIPGLGGAFILVVMIPFLYAVDPLVAIAALIAASATDGTGNSVTSILFGVPGSATATAMLLDGHPMARRGMAGRAVGAALTASAVGGVIGAITLAFVIPIARPFVLAFGPVEFFVLIVAALLTLAYVREEAFLKGLASAALGLSLTVIGMDGATATQRYTGGQLYLWDGLPLVPVLLGMFAVTEAIDMLQDARAGRRLVAVKESGSGYAGWWEGVKDVFRHWDATWLGSWIGLIIGMLPGIGGAAGQFMAYTAVAKSTQARGRFKDLPPFGQGNVRGVIGTDAATNSTTGGELVPVLVFGIPSSSTMAIVLGALIVFGIQPGPRMLDDSLDIVWMMIFVLVLSNILAAALVLAFIKPLARLAYVRPAILAPAILAISYFGAYATTRHWGDLVVVTVFGIVGYLFKRYGFGRVTFLIGFVLGSTVEHYLVLSLQIHGVGFIFARPLAMAMLGLLVVALGWSAARWRLARKEGRS